ncbi:MAG TPA: O-antigen ligase family protein [Solirubrobacterales bacterium]|nr:O-antigen ligase family protein [Solirubrobacterales bacterium]
MAAAARAIPLPQPQVLRRVLAAGLIALVALAVGATAVVSIQAATTFVLLVLLVAVRKESRSGGLLVMWSFWFLAPGLRRVFDLSGAAPGADPLSLLPFAATVLLAAMELWEDRLDRRARWILGLGVAAIGLGLPMGLLVDPAAAIFAATAYGAAISAFVLGWGDGTSRISVPTLHRALAVAMVPLSLYAILQYFVVLPVWDSKWVASDPLGSLNAPQEGHIRIFSTLNAPFTFAILLAAGILLVGLGRRRSLRRNLFLLVPSVLALALTYMRSAWLGLVVGLIVFAILMRGQVSKRVFVVAIVCTVVLIAAGSGNSTTRAFTERVTSLGSPGKDVSAQSRLERTNQLVPVAIRQPAGAGLGQSGLTSAKIGGSTDEFLTAVDNGYLSLLYQSGPVAFAMLVAALGGSVVAAARGLRRREGLERQAQAALIAALAMLLVALFAGEVLFGLPGAILWYLCGLAAASSRRAGGRVLERPVGSSH